MKRSQLSLLSLALISAFSAAYADDETIAGRIPLSDDNHAQMAAENVQKINSEMVSGSLNAMGNEPLATSNVLGKLKVPADLQVNAYQPEITQSYDLDNHMDYISSSLKTTNNKQQTTNNF